MEAEEWMIFQQKKKVKNPLNSQPFPTVAKEKTVLLCEVMMDTQGKLSGEKMQYTQDVWLALLASLCMPNPRMFIFS